MKPIEIDGKKWLTAPDAAELGGVETVTIYQNIARERLSKSEIAGRIIVPLDEVLALWPQAEEATV